jgi:hypothetical protein
MNALKTLEKALDDLELVQKQGKLVIASWEEKLDRAKAELEQADKALDEALNTRPRDEDSVAALQESFNLCEDLFLRVRGELDVWRRDSARHTTIALCTTFESFLREFFIEHMLHKPDLFEIYLSKQVGISVKLAAMPPEEVEVDECIALKHRMFQNLKGDGSVQRAFDDFLQETGPFAEGGKSEQLFLENKDRQNAFGSNTERVTALADVRLLFQIRHQLIHRNGKDDPKYQKTLQSFRNQLNEDFMKEYPKAVESYRMGVLPGPDKILASPPRDTGQQNENKLEECSRSLRSYARYIVQVYG